MYAAELIMSIDFENCNLKKNEKEFLVLEQIRFCLNTGKIEDAKKLVDAFDIKYYEKEFGEEAEKLKFRFYKYLL